MTLYDQVRYPCSARSQTHPERLATAAVLLGMQPAPVTSCRVLELGCNDGANIIAMALGLPESRFLGVDLAEIALAEGRDVIAQLGLRNIQLHALDVGALGDELGEFDYIIAHGLYSWVPSEVRDRIMQVCGRNLAPQGVAFISYNVNPGWQITRIVRDMALYHVAGFADPVERVNQARSLLKFVVDSQWASEAYGALLKKELDRLAERQEAALFHDELAEVNDPIYFHEFVEHAGRHGLQYLAEAETSPMADQAYPDAVVAALAPLDPIRREQYLDFFRCRRFRQTLLCRREVGLDRSLAPERLQGLYISAPTRPVFPQVQMNLRSVERFRGGDNASVQVDHPLAKAALLYLGEIWPRSVSFDELLRHAAASLPPLAPIRAAGADPEAPDAQALASILLRASGPGLVELQVWQPQYVMQATECPVASPLARLQLQQGPRATNLRHSTVEIEDPMLRAMVVMLDGTRDRTALARDLIGMLDPASDPQAAEVIRARLDEALERIAGHALLVA
jgi:SAM-dependent methyltransferase